ncbi:hypothetical protein HKX48_001893 [Thoreauomyces humboldtii]|nr:hypothetical protein HKX48_001893 [Thoreauomyces humboldtii]
MLCLKRAASAVITTRTSVPPPKPARCCCTSQRSSLSTTAVTLARSGGGSPDAAKKAKDATTADKRYQLIREMLYDRTVPTTPARPVKLPTAESVSCPVVIGDSTVAQMDTIERAWAMEKQKEAAAKVAELRDMYESMREAMVQLEKTDVRLFEAAKVGAARKDVTVFPRRLRVPTETPPIDGWDYDMKAGNKQ